MSVLEDFLDNKLLHWVENEIIRSYKDVHVNSNLNPAKETKNDELIFSMVTELSFIYFIGHRSLKC